MGAFLLVVLSRKEIQVDNLYDIYQTSNFIIDKVRNGYISPEEFSLAISVGQTSTYQKYFNQYRIGSEVALEALRPFFKHTNLTSSVSGGVTYPDDFGFLQNAYTTMNGQEWTVQEILHDELEYYTGSKINPLSSANVKLIQEGVGCQLYPKRKITAEYHYIAKPTTPELVYSTDGVSITPIVGSGFSIIVNSVSSTPPTVGEIAGVAWTAPMGSGFIDGTYTSIPLVGGTGAGATIDFTVANGSVTILSVNDGGLGYVISDVLTIDTTTELGFDKQFWVEIMNEALKYIGLNLSNQELLQVMAQQ